MNKNTIHNFNLSIKNNTSKQSPEDLTKAFIKELAVVSKEMSQQKDITQIWQEQNSASTAIKNIVSSAEEGVSDTNAVNKTVASFNTTSSVPESYSSTSIKQGVADTSGSRIKNSFTSVNNTLPVSEAKNGILNNSISQIYESVNTKQMLTVPQSVQTNNEQPSIELIKAEIKKKLDQAKKEKDTETIEYLTRISNAFEKGATIADFDNKPDEMLFTQMVTALKQSKISSVEIQNFNWESVRQKMIKAIDANILKEKISDDSKRRWTTIKMQLSNDKENVANLFEQYDELFLLLKEVEGLESLPNTISITTKTRIYPNLSADKLYASIGKDDVYVFLKSISDLQGSGVNKGAVKIKNTNDTSFIVGESLEFLVDEALINQSEHKKENINWMVYKGREKKGPVFRDKGTSFTYNFDSAGTYKVEAYGHTYGANSKNAKESAFVTLNIIAQEILITAPANIKGEFTRTFTEEKAFKVSLKNTKVKPLNPIKLYYQIETVISGKSAVISEEKELDSTGIIKLAMPDLGIYKIKVSSKDQYGLVKEFKTSVIKNEVTSIGLEGKSSESNIFLLGITKDELTLEAKTFKINPPTDDEKEDVSWVVYNADNKPYIAPGFELSTDKGDSKKSYMLKWKSFTTSIPQEVGNYTVEAFSDCQKGAKSQCTYKFEVKEPQIAEAYWSWSGGTIKTISGLSEDNYINASIPHYNNQKVRIYFYLNDKKTNHFIDVKTNEKGELFEKVNFDSDFQKLIGFESKKNTKIGFKLLGIQNGKPYQFKSPANYEANTSIAITAEKKVLDVYFTYDGKRVTSEDEVPFGAKGAIVTLVAKTQNMVGEEIELKAHKINEKPSFVGKAKVSSEGIAATKFILKNLDKKLKIGTQIKYYAGVEGCSTKHLDDKLKVLVMIVGEGKINDKIGENELELIWGGKVSVAFRQKVISICKDMWGEDKKHEMANALMIAMSVETGETFSSSLIRSTKLGYVGVSKEEHKNNPDLVKGKPIGLAQFTEDGVKSLILKEKGILENKETAKAIPLTEVNEYKQKLALLSPEDQLDYVKTYFMLFNNHKKVKRPEDVYMIIFAPRATGKGDDVDLYEKYLTKEDRDKKNINPKYSKNASMDTKNDGFNKGNNDEIIQSGELLARYREMKAKGLRYSIDINEARKLNQVLAEKIIKSGRVTFASSHQSGIKDNAMAIDNITDTSLGKNAKRSNYENAPGGEISILSEMLYILYELSKDYKMNISEISGASHSINSYHYKGVAFDINEIDGVHMGKKGKPSFSLDIHEKIRKIAKNNGATKVLDPYNRPTDHYNHIHIEITK